MSDQAYQYDERQYEADVVVRDTILVWAGSEDERQYEADVVVRDTILVWAGSEDEVRAKAAEMGYVNVEAVREVPDEAPPP